VQKTVASRRLSNVSFFPYQPNELLRQSLGAIDLHLVTLKPGMEGLLSPSKIYGVMAAGRPLAFVGEKAGEIAGLVESGGLGFVVGHGEGAELAEKIQQLAVDAGPLRSMGERARSLFDREFALPRAVDRWRTILSHAGDER
jgi:glycosyltransferase involved in cell wall biosynthesis